jgi:DNA repair protein RadA/Sms
MKGHSTQSSRSKILLYELLIISFLALFQDILGKIQHLSPRALIIDSIQTVYLKGVAGSAGGLSQVGTLCTIDCQAQYQILA